MFEARGREGREDFRMDRLGTPLCPKPPLARTLIVARASRVKAIGSA
jgi:hypothetical protein